MWMKSMAREDDPQLISALVARGATLWSVPADGLAVWRKTVEAVTRKFESAYPEVMQAYRKIAQP
jgi:hypothetical protein